MADKRALILRDEGMAIGIMGFSAEAGSIDFLAVHPQYRNLGIEKVFLDKLVDELLAGKEISLTTYREGDKADTGYREEYLRLVLRNESCLLNMGILLNALCFHQKIRRKCKMQQAQDTWKKKIILFLISHSITLFGSQIVQMAIVWYVTLHTTSGAWVAVFSVCSYLPQFLVSFVGGVWADRYNRKFLIIGAE